jgi:hypothetical protein
MQTSRENDISSDPHVHIFSIASTNRAARTLLTPFIIILLLAPVIICNTMANFNARLAIVVISATIFVTILALFTHARTVELVVAGAT